MADEPIEVTAQRKALDGLWELHERWCAASGKPKPERIYPRQLPKGANIVTIYAKRDA